MKGAWKKYLGVFGPMALVVAAPMILRDDDAAAISNAELRLDVITPHNELIRREFGEAFSAWYKEENGEDVYVNWRTPGGTSEIKRVLDSAFGSAANNNKEGIGLDLFFGGGVFDFQLQAKEGRFQKLSIFDTSPELFVESIIPESQSGETYYPEERDWLGVCLSSFGICYNTDSLARLKITAPTTWDELGNPEYNRGIA
jgi:iron(III) transport system substrate-binding protein